MELLTFIGISIGLLFFIWRLYRYFWLKSYRARINDYRESIVYDKSLEDTWLKVGLKTLDGTKISFIKCTIVHVYADRKVSAIIKDPFKSFARAKSITANINDIYPGWAVPRRQINKGFVKALFEK